MHILTQAHAHTDTETQRKHIYLITIFILHDSNKTLVTKM